MHLTKTLLLSTLLVTIAGCSAQKNTVKTMDLEAAGQLQQIENSTLLPKEVIPSNTSSCIDDVTLLKQTHDNDDQALVAQYSDLMNEYEFLRENSEIMDKDTKLFLTNRLAMKRDTLCARIKSKAMHSS